MDKSEEAISIVRKLLENWYESNQVDPNHDAIMFETHISIYETGKNILKILEIYKEGQN